MLRAIALVVLFVVTALPVSAGAKMEVAARNKNDRHVFTLYRNSHSNAEMRIHVATFDSNNRAEYNRYVCEKARKLFDKDRLQRVSKELYWCEPGRYRR